MNYIIIQDICFLLVLIGLAVPLGFYITRVMSGEKHLLSKIGSPLENGIYKLMGVQKNSEMTAKKYLLSVIGLSIGSFLVVFLLLLCQGFLPMNPNGIKGMGWHQAFNVAASFVSNTNWQSYAGENSVSYLTQMVGLCVQNFLSAAVGISVLFALIRGFINKEKATVGNFWQDLIRTTLYILLPLSIISAIVLVSQGVVQTFDGNHTVYSLADSIKHIAPHIVPLGPAASQIAIKQLGTNGGGFFGANSAFPLENPTSLSNFIELLSILLLPMALCFSFGKAVKNNKQGRTIFTVMLILLVLSLSAVTYCEQFTAIAHAHVSLAAGNMIGKETVNGVGSSALWGTATTAASNGSVNASLDSFAPGSGIVLLFLMQIGEVVFGGAGSGLYGMLAFVILTVFIAGLMVGRTPEYLGKKIEPFNMKMVCLVVLTPPLMVLFGTAIAVLIPSSSSWLKGSGAHGFSEILYAFSSMGNNNGSAFAGFSANTPFTNIAGGFIMLISRFIPMTAVILMAGNLGAKKNVAASEGTLSTTTPLFVGMLIVIILLIGALSFLPALALGPIADALKG